MKIPRASRLVAAALMLALAPAAVLSDRALRWARDAALERAQDGSVEEAARAGLALRALIAAVEAMQRTNRTRRAPHAHA